MIDLATAAPAVAAGLADYQQHKLESIEAWLLSQSVQAEYELKHSFAPGVYLREIFMPAPKIEVEEGQIAGTLLIGHEHTGEHFNMVLSGRALVLMDGKVEEIVGPCYFRSMPGVRKVLYVVEDMRWVTIHPNEDNERDIAKLEARYVKTSAVFDKFQQLIALEEFQKHGEQFKPRLETILP